MVDLATRELALFACIGLLIGGVDDLLIDILWMLRRSRVAMIEPDVRLRLAIFTPVWDEAGVIGAMLRRTLRDQTHPDFRCYVGVYLNDRASAREVAAVARHDARVRVVVNSRAGPTTKGDNLNAMWRALIRDEAAEGWRADAVVLHDAEDVLDPEELGVFDRLLARFDLVQFPVVPLVLPTSRWISAHYADEFALAHERTLTVRQRLGAALPLAGVGCAVGRGALDRAAAARGGSPFDADSLTEDYELGLAVAELGGRSLFARVHGTHGRQICVRSYFPDTVAAAVRQKSRWVAGIALLGWDRLGWGANFRLGEIWMRMRDRRAPLAMLVLAAAYLAMLGGAVSAVGHLGAGTPPPALAPGVVVLLTVNSALLAWRLAARGFATARIYGWREGIRAVPRSVVSNFIGLLAVRRALTLYLGALRGTRPRWDKTTHVYPAEAAA